MAAMGKNLTQSRKGAETAEKVRLGDVCKLSKGVQINGSDLSNEYEYPFLNGGVEPSGRWKEFNVEGNSVTISEGGNSCGFVNFFPNRFWCGAHCYYLYDLECDAKYLFHALKSQQPRIMALRTGVCMPNIKKSLISEFEITYHKSFAEQKRIAATLDRICELKKNAETRLAKLDLIVKSRFVEMFGDPVENSKGWKQQPLYSLLATGASVTYGIVKTGEHVPNGVPVFRPVDIVSGRVPTLESLKRTSLEVSQQYKRTILDGTELLITVRGSVGDTFQVTPEFCGCNVGRNIVPLRLNDKRMIGRYLQVLFSIPSVAHVLATMTKGIALQGINMCEFREMRILTPPLALQYEFAAFVAKVDKLALSVRKTVEQLDVLYRSKLQEYFE